MTGFTDDPSANRVVDPRGNSLMRYYRDAPVDEAWFTFLFEGTPVLAKAKYSAAGNRVESCLRLISLKLHLLGGFQTARFDMLRQLTPFDQSLFRLCTMP